MNEEQVEGYEEVPEEQGEEEEARTSAAQELAFRIGTGVGTGLRRVATGVGSGVAAFGRNIAAAPPITPLPGQPFFGAVAQHEPGHELDDLFEVPQPEDNDMYTDDLLAVDGEEAVGDLLEVTMEDIMGEAPTPKDKAAPRYKRTAVRYSPTGLTGVQ